MKKLLTVVVLFIYSLSFAQEVEITKSSIFKDKKKRSYLSYSLDDNKGGLITIRVYFGGLVGQKIKGYYIQHFDSDLKIVKELDYKIKNAYIRDAFIRDGKLHLIEMEKGDDSLVMSVKSGDLTSLEFTNKELLSFSKDNLRKYTFASPIFGGFGELDGDHFGEVITSANNNYFAINFDVKNKKKETHQIFVFNSKFEKVYEKLITRNVKDKLFIYNDVTVDDDNGTVYFLGKAYENGSRKEEKKGKVNYHFELIKVNKNTVKEVSFKDSKRLIGSLTLLNNRNKIVAIGFYGKESVWDFNGVCVFDLDPITLELKSKKFSEFSEKFMTDKYGDKTRKKKKRKKKGVRDIDFKSVYLMENGEIVLNAEEFFTRTHTSNFNGSLSTYTTVHFNDIISIRINKDGSLKWSRNVNKVQAGVFNTSFTSLAIGEVSYFFINCSDKIKTSKAGQIVFGGTHPKKSNLYVISVDGNGKINYKKLIDDKDSKVFYRVNNGVVDLENQTVTFIGKKKKNTQILKLKL